MNVNAIFFIILIISSFTAIVSFLLKGKYYKTALVLSILNIASATTAFFTIHFPENQCRANPYAINCGKHSGLYLLICLLNIIFGIIIWYLAFRRKDPQPLVFDSAHPITGSQLAQQGDKEGLRKFLTASGSLVTLGIIGFVVLIVVIFVVAILSI